MERKPNQIPSPPPSPSVVPGTLKPRHEKFVDSYIANGGNGTKAALEAGYNQKPDSLRNTASWLLKKPEIRDRLMRNLRDAFDQFNEEALRSEPGISIDAVFERFAEKETVNCGLDVSRYRAEILKGYESSPDAETDTAEPEC